MTPNPDIIDLLQKTRAALEFVENSSAKGYLPDSKEELQSHSDGLRELTSLIAQLPSAIAFLRREVHNKRMEVQNLQKRDDKD